MFDNSLRHFMKICESAAVETGSIPDLAPTGSAVKLGNHLIKHFGMQGAKITHDSDENDAGRRKISGRVPNEHLDSMINHLVSQGYEKSHSKPDWNNAKTHYLEHPSGTSVQWGEIDHKVHGLDPSRYPYADLTIVGNKPKPKAIKTQS